MISGAACFGIGLVCFILGMFVGGSIVGEGGLSKFFFDKGKYSGRCTHCGVGLPSGTNECIKCLSKINLET